LQAQTGLKDIEAAEFRKQRTKKNVLSFIKSKNFDITPAVSTLGCDTTDDQQDQQSHQMGNGCDSSSLLAWHLDEYRGQKVLSTRQHAANNTEFKALQGR
jgi:hypothetical protein